MVIKKKNKWTADQLAQQFARTRRPDGNGQIWYDGFTRAASAYHVPLGVLFAIASRETNIQNIIGDGGHGYGIMQIDIRYHGAFVKAGIWKSPAASIAKGAQILADFRKTIQRFANRRYRGITIPRITEPDLTRVAVACYNAGFNAVVEYVINGNPDLATTGKDYSQDVLDRAEVFEQLIDKLNMTGETNASSQSERDGS